MRAAETKIRHAARDFSCWAGRVKNCSRMCEAIEIENKAMTILGKPGRQMKIVMAENTAAIAAPRRYQLPFSPCSAQGLPVSKIKKSWKANNTRENRIAASPIATTFIPVEVVSQSFLITDSMISTYHVTQ